MYVFLWFISVYAHCLCMYMQMQLCIIYYTGSQTKGSLRDVSNLWLPATHTLATTHTLTSSPAWPPAALPLDPC
jgi:hypothetical protein